MRSSPDATQIDPTETSRPSKSALAPGTLAIVATPIGNLGDFSRRAAEALTDAAVIACEDTRMTARLLAAYGIRTPMLAYHEHNAARMRPLLIERLKAGGYKLVEAALAEGIAVTPIPGASASLAALVVSGLPSDRFLFAGFLPPRGPARRTEIRTLATVPATLIFYEAPGRVAKSLADLLAVLGDRRAAVARELTKRFEEVRRGRLTQLAAAYAAGPDPKGEVVIVVGPPEAAPAGETNEAALDHALELALADHSVREAASLVAAETGFARRMVYARALALRKSPDRV
jgi:16S rRNA (cytidine1402-2'-O)-methyltransferase